MKTIRFKIESSMALLQHDDKTANPLNEYAKKLKEITKIRKKSDEDHMEMARIEWRASLYFNEQERYHIKAECFEGTFLQASKAFKQGTIFKQAVQILNNPTFKFRHDKLSPEQLFEMNEYKDFRTVKVSTSKIIRCRPIFHEWNTEVEIYYDENRIDENEITKIVEYGGQYIGVCDYRPKFGRFTATKIS
jgi:hypothetical protein